ncbi:MAG: hypothetical protein ACRD0L_00305 [Acidimicrobiales bacterium]
MTTPTPAPGLRGEVMHPFVGDAIVAQRTAELRAVAADGWVARQRRQARRLGRQRDHGAAVRRWQQRLGGWLVTAGLGLMARAG